MRDDVNVPRTPLAELDYIQMAREVLFPDCVFKKPDHAYGTYTTEPKFLGINPRWFILDEIQTFSSDSGSKTPGKADNSQREDSDLG